MMKNNSMKKIKIARVTTIPLAFVHFKSHLVSWRDSGAEVHLIASAGDYWKTLDEEVGLQKHIVNIPRDISPLRDLCAVFDLWKLFRKEKYDIVHSTTPKAGLLVAIAGFLARVPVRLHTFTGQRWATLNGPLRFFLKALDYLVSRLNTHSFADSPSQVEFLKGERAVHPQKISCLHKGCLGGIDFKKFDVEKWPDQKVKLRKELNIDFDSLLLFYLGRITRDKGIEELIEAFLNLLTQGHKLHLVFVGDFEEPLAPAIKQTILAHSRIRFLGFQNKPQAYLAGADVFCMPSYREGFGTVILEAAAFKLPSIGTKIPGLIDSIIDNETGILVEVKNSLALEKAIKKFIEIPDLKFQLGENAYQRAKKDFEDSILSEAMWKEYLRLIPIDD